MSNCTWKLLLILSLVSISYATQEVNITSVIRNLLTGYDKQIRPNYNGPAVKVGITMYVLLLYSVSEKDLEFTVDMYFRQTWNDNRLIFPSEIDTLQLRPQDIWTPDTFFPLAKKSSLSHVMRPNVFLMLKHDGTVRLSAKVTTTSSCPMNFALYPMDKQICKLEIESYGSHDKDITYHFAKGESSVGISPDVTSSQLRFQGYKQKAQRLFLSTGNYSRLMVEFNFQRSLKRHIMNVYFPSALIVVLSWMGFWLGTNKTSRICLGLITIFILIEMMLNVDDDVPKLNYIMAIDVYLLACMLMAAFTLIEFALICFLHEEDYKGDKLMEFDLSKKCQPLVCNLDKYSRIAFPLLFILFNLLYWIITLTVSTDQQEE